MLRVLIVDDEPASAEMIRIMLEKHFPRLVVAGIAYKVSEAVEHLIRNDIDLLFLDIVLNKESGFDLLDKVLNRSFQFITLSATKDFAFKTFEYGGSGYLLKPVSVTELSGALSNLFRQNLLFSPNRHSF